MRAPELVFWEPVSSAIDIWAFGCLVYEFITGTRLFAVDLIGDDEQEEADDHHILDFIDVLGPLPEHLMAKWSRQDKWIGPGGERFQPSEPENSDDIAESDEDFEAEDATDANADGPEEIEDDDFAEPFINEPLEAQFSLNKPEDIDEGEARVITALIREMLQYERSRRPTAEQLLRHEWFQE